MDDIVLHIGSSLTDPENLYLVIPVILIIVFLLAMKFRRSPLAPIAKPGPTYAIVAFAFAMFLIQSFHMLEHYAQVFQKFTLGIKGPHGLIGQIDLEWVHFTYNVAVFIAMVGLFYAAEFHRRDGWPWVKNTSLATVFTAGVVIQGYHVIEHVVRIIQHIQTGIQGTPGILGYILDPVLLHYYLNVIIYIPILLIFFGYDFHRYVAGVLFKRGIPVPARLRIPIPTVGRQTPSVSQTPRNPFDMKP